MSLVGSLEDLSLGDILQIISLSQKSGVLALKTTGSAGRILFVDGLVRGAVLKEGPQGLRDILVDGGFLAADAFDEANEQATSEGVALSSALAVSSTLTEERIDSLCRETIEAAVVNMFGWTKGEFSFDVRNVAEPGDPESLIAPGLNAQYLAMEGARVSDEDVSGQDAMGEASSPDQDAQASTTARAREAAEAGFDAMSAHEMFGVVADEPAASASPVTGAPAPEAVDHLAMATLDRVDGESSREDAAGISDISDQIFEADPLEVEPLELESLADAADELELEILDSTDLDSIESPPILEPVPEMIDELELGDLTEGVASEDPEPDVDAVPYCDEGALSMVDGDSAPRAERADDTDADSQASRVEGAPRTTLIVLDPSLQALEWIKRALSESFERVHIFQNTQQALARIRQYLVRGEPPVVLISTDVEVDRMAGIKDAGDFIARLKGQSPRLIAIWLREEGADSRPRLARSDGSVTRPDRSALKKSLESENIDAVSERFASQLHLELDAALSQTSASVPFVERRKEISSNALRRLRDATRALTEASSRGEVLPLVIRFASEIFGRVAMFMVRDGHAVGMAQNGLAECGGPDDAALRSLRFETSESDWLSAVLERGKPVRGAPTNDGDRALSSALGDGVPEEAYLAPIESTGQVIAVLYADNLPASTPITDTSALEVVLHHAGLALDRAALERALHEDSGGEPRS